ncbi:hypothetical protein F4775DRAFT_548148 [Biscogniauxia sp. FL1348]|nr:hypothetical protein F4775DRAFT_548148 [Biscogniauxia sp. FL1348]
MTSITTKQLETKLLTSVHWSEWYFQYRRRARAYGITDYVDPETTNHLTLREPPQPSRAQIATSLKVADPFNADVIERYKILVEEWKPAYQEYLLRRKAVQELEIWVASTVDIGLLRIAGDGDLYTTVKALKEKVSYTAVQEKNEARRRYQAALCNTGIPVETWYRDWETARIEAKRLSIPEVQGELAMETFLDAVVRMAPSWSEHIRVRIQLESEIGSGSQPYSLETLGKLFIRFSRDSHDGKSFQFTTLGGRKPPRVDCACGRRHSFQPKDCNVVSWAILGKATPMCETWDKPEERVIQSCKATLSKDVWKGLVEEVRGRQQYPSQVAA